MFTLIHDYIIIHDDLIYYYNYYFMNGVTIIICIKNYLGS